MKIPFKIFVLTILLFTGCEKDAERNSDGHIIVKGSNRLIVSVIHHTWAVTNIQVWLKEDATEFPGTNTSLYDWSATTDAGGTAIFNELFPGNYFLYAKGFDTVFGAEVHGYYPVVLNESTLSNNELYFTLYVSE